MSDSYVLPPFAPSRPGTGAEPLAATGWLAPYVTQP